MSDPTETPHDTEQTESAVEDGDSTLVIGTDYGHNDTSSEILALRKLREDGDVPPQVVKKILDDNAKALYSL